LTLFETLLPETRYVGEIGLDGGPEYAAYWDDQIKVFAKILELCKLAGGRILSVHSRRAATPVLDVLSKFQDAGPAVLHWFTGNLKELDRAIDLGCWFSVGPAMLAGAKGRSLVAKMPRDRILTESDGPFAQIQGRSALPWEASGANIQLAQLWGVTEADVELQLMVNLRRLVRPA
jgi:TatD DNase family protein